VVDEELSTKYLCAVSKWTLIYDGECEFCRRQVGLVARWDRAGHIEAVPFQRAELERYGVGRDAAEQAMQLVAPSGAVWSGAAAARELSRLLPTLRPFAWLFYVPGATFIAERTYRWVAKHRHRFGCKSRVCRRGDTRRRTD
jgi:predicted DCC family thiol-disulfide oxidoreductase YuxK